MTRIMRQMVAVGTDPMAMKTHHEHGYSDSGSDIGGNIGGPVPMGAITNNPWAGTGGGTLAPSPPVENFGATIVRELMSLLGTRKSEAPAPSLSEMDRLIDSIAFAREKGLKDVEKTLLKQLVKLTAAEKRSDLPPGYEPLTSKTTNGVESKP